jgi:hypothetical protein
MGMKVEAPLEPPMLKARVAASEGAGAEAAAAQIEGLPEVATVQIEGCRSWGIEGSGRSHRRPVRRSMSSSRWGIMGRAADVKLTGGGQAGGGPRGRRGNGGGRQKGMWKEMPMWS